MYSHIYVGLVILQRLICMTRCALKEETVVLACHDETVVMNCHKVRNSTLVIYEARFSTDGGSFSSSSSSSSTSLVSYTDRCRYDSASARNESCSDDVRLVVNSRCSGMASCKFQVSDLVPRECYGEGMLRLTHGCAPASSVIKFCNVDINGSIAEGFIQNPGYPNYYPGLQECRWTIRAEDGQRVLVSLLDMSIQATAGTMADCRDSLQIYDGVVKVMHSCGQDGDFLHSFKSVTNIVRIVFTSRDVWPSRGIMFYYRVLGCATIPAPFHGYLVYRNKSMAHYMCCARHVFVDDYKRNRFLYCQDGNRWNGTLVTCRHITVLRQWKNMSGVTFEEEVYDDEDIVSRISMQSASILFDILIPSLIMVGMVICNVIIVVVILRMRRRRAKDDEDDDSEIAPFKNDLEPQPSTSKSNGLDTVVEPTVTRV